MISINGQAYYSESEIKGMKANACQSTKSDIAAAAAIAERFATKPSDGYSPKFARTAVELGTEGMSKIQIAAWFNETPSKLDEWAKNHPPFAVALIRALDASQTYWNIKATSGR